MYFRTKKDAASSRARAAWLMLLMGLSGCGGRSPDWDLPARLGEATGLSGCVAVPDLPRDDLLMLTSPSAGELRVQRLPVGKNIVSTVASADLEKFFVLTRGESPRLNQDDEKPRLSVIQAGPEPALLRDYTLEDPAQKIALDPAGQWAIVYDSGGVVVNVNELVLVDLAHPDRLPIPKTIRSTGGRPERFTFTDPLWVPGAGAHRFLVVETQQDVTVLDLEDPEAAEVTVPVPMTAQGSAATPAQVAYVNGAEDRPSYLAVRFKNDVSLMALELSAAAVGADQSFSLRPNLLDAGGVASALEFVQTDNGLRLAALVPGRKQAVLIDPTTSRSEKVELGIAFSRISRITGLSGIDEGALDVALLYGEGTSSVAFWRLGSAASTPYASFDTYATTTPVARVNDIPGTEFGYMKLLLGSDGYSFSLLDLQSRLIYPMQGLLGFRVSFSPDGRQVWAFPPNETRFARLTLADKHPTSYDVERPISEVFEIQRRDGGRSALVMHQSRSAGGEMGVTLFDAEQPDSALTRFVSGLVWEGI